jgi:hypothetical protein
VQFRLEGGRVAEVQSVGSNWDNRPFVRRAVKQLNCGPSGVGIQDFAFMLEIVGTDDAAGQDRVTDSVPRDDQTIVKPAVRPHDPNAL